MDLRPSFGYYLKDKQNYIIILRLCYYRSSCLYMIIDCEKSEE